MHKAVLFAVLFCSLGALSCGGKGKPTLKLEKTDFEPGEKIMVSYRIPASYRENAWVGVIPSNVPHGDESLNDQYDLSYFYLKKQTSGVLTFIAPDHAGSYDLRMHDTDDNGKEVASISFRVIVVNEGATLRLEKTDYAPGEDINVTFTAPAEFDSSAWVGIIPSDVPHGSETENDQYDIAYQYLRKKTQGVLVFKAPEKIGRYDLRMHDIDNDGNEITYVGFTVQ